jgi:hypothetical protein
MEDILKERNQAQFELDILDAVQKHQKNLKTVDMIQSLLKISSKLTGTIRVREYNKVEPAKKRTRVATEKKLELKTDTKDLGIEKPDKKKEKAEKKSGVDETVKS